MTTHMRATTTPFTPIEPPTRRLFHFDNLRVALTVLVVAHHAALTYGNIPLWYYVEGAEDNTGVLLDLLVLVNQSFFMGFFFLIAGYFTPASFDRKGPRAFLRGRLIRLAIPLALFVLVLRPVLTLDSYLAKPEQPYWLYYIVTWDPGPMWFVEVLLIFCLGYTIVHRFRRRRDRHLAATETMKQPNPLAIIGFGVGLGVTTYVWRAIMTAPFWPIVGLPSPGYLPQYASLFIVGVYAYRKGWFNTISRRAMTWAGVTAACSLVVYIPLMAIAGAVETAWSPVMLASSLTESGVAIGIIVFGIGLFQRMAHRQNVFGRFLSGNAFAVYFVHPLVLVAAGYALSAWEAPAIAKFAALTLLGLPLCWIVARTVRAIPGAQRVF